MKIADLFASLKIEVDNSSVKAADKLLDHYKEILVGFGVYKAVGWIKGMVDATVELGGTLSDTSQQLGISTTVLQELGFAAAQSGSSFEGMSAGLRILQRNAFAASKGSKEAAQGFADLGVNLKENGKLRPTADLLADIADKVRLAPDTEKAAIAMKAFGRSGATLVPLLNEGSAGIAALRKEFVELGGEISEEGVVALEAFGDEQDKVRVALSGLRNQLVIALLPTLRSLNAAFMEWYKANREMLVERLTAAFRALGIVLRLAWKALSLLLSAFGWLIDHGDQVAFILAVIGARMLALRTWTLMAAAATTLFSRASWAAGLTAAKAWVVAALPLVAMIAIIAAVILIVEDLYYWITGGESVFKRSWEKILKALPEWFQAALGGMKLMLSDFADFVSDVFAGINEMFKDYGSQANRMALREEGKARGLKGKELEAFVEQGVKNEITGNAGGVNTGPTLGRAGATAFDYTSLGKLFYGAQQQQNLPAAMAFAPAAAQATFAAGGGAMSFSPQINITLPPGTDANGVAAASKNAFTEAWQEQMRRLRAGAGK